MGVNKMSSGVMSIIDFVMLIWGSVVVFGAWATWTDDLEEYNSNMDELNYCKYQPMIFAFSILLIKWVSSLLEQQDDCLAVTIKSKY